MAHGSVDNCHRERSWKQKSDLATAASLHARFPTSCVFCDSPDHPSHACDGAKGMTLDGRKDVLFKKRRCFACWGKNHSSNRCRSNVTCGVCQKRHRDLMCPLQEKEEGHHNASVSGPSWKTESANSGLNSPVEAV